MARPTAQRNMESKFEVSEHPMGHAGWSLDGSRQEISMNANGDALTAPTRRQMNSVKNQFEGWFDSLNYSKNITQLSKMELADVVKRFYMTTRKKDGNPYKLCSYLAIRRCLSLIFQFDYGLKHVDISCDPEFLDANVVFSQMSHSLRGREENFGVNESWRLTPEKLKKLYAEGQLDFYNTQNPQVLLQTVYFYVCYYTGTGKLSVMRQVCMSDVQEVLENGRLIAYNFDLRKYLPTEKGVGPFTIYEIQGKPWCPVLTIREYLLHRNKSVQSFFQKPLTRAQCFGSSVWFKKSRFKDIYPLANMCREANIDPALTSGCFAKARISAEIRYEMSFVYAKLFPQCFNSPDEVHAKVKLNSAKRKRARKGANWSSQNLEAHASAPNSTVVNSVNQVRQNRIKNTANVSIRNGLDKSDENDTIPSMVVTRNYQESVVQPVSHTNAVNEKHLLERSAIPTISVANVFSCRKSDSTSILQQPTDTANHTTQLQPAYAPEHSVIINQVANSITNEKTNSKTEHKKVISIDDDPDDDPPITRATFQHDEPHLTGDIPQSTVFFTSQESSRYVVGNCEQPRSQQTNSTSSSNSGTQVTRVVEMHPSLHMVAPAESQYGEVPMKKSRFDNSSHTFLREISASAREQGKGAVMLLLSLLDDLSNNRGKELLTDILQEMRVL